MNNIIEIRTMAIKLATETMLQYLRTQRREEVENIVSLKSLIARASLIEDFIMRDVKLDTTVTQTTQAPASKRADENDDDANDCEERACFYMQVYHDHEGNYWGSELKSDMPDEVETMRYTGYVGVAKVELL